MRLLLLAPTTYLSRRYRLPHSKSFPDGWAVVDVETGTKLDAGGELERLV